MEDKLLIKIQDVEYEALVKIKEICDKNNITFFMRSGSVLGAVKYNNFVPWDDDIDIMLPRPDYEKLINIVSIEIDGKYQFVSYRKMKNAHCYFPRIVLNEKTRIEADLPKNNERGLVLVDILPIDAIPDNAFLSKVYILKTYIYRILASLWTLDVKDTVSMHSRNKQMLLKILHMLKIHHLYQQDYIYAKMDSLFTSCLYNSTKKVAILMGSKIEKEIIPIAWLGNGIKTKFRELDVSIPEQYDLYLKKLFGENYKTFEPPLEARTKSHIRGMNK